MSFTPNTTSFIDAIQSAIGFAPNCIIEDGRIHRFSTDANKPRNTSGWYVCYGDNGVYGDWRSGSKEYWHGENHFVDRAKLERLRTERTIQKQAIQSKASTTAQLNWDKATPASSDNPYLQLKGVNAYGVRTLGNALIIPIRNTKGQITSLQFIYDDGKIKRFLSGGSVAGCFHIIGDPTKATDICVAEGYATAASIHEATGCPVAVAFFAGNIKPVASVLRALYPGLEMIICADDDAWTTNNPGMDKAIDAARAVNAYLVVPQFPSDRVKGDTDFNDLANKHGLEAVKACFDNKTYPQPEPVIASPKLLEQLFDVAKTKIYKIPFKVNVEDFVAGFLREWIDNGGSPETFKTLGARIRNLANWKIRQGEVLAQQLTQLSNATIETDLSVIRKTISEIGGIHLIRAGHGAGKTDHILVPLVLHNTAMGVVISNRVSLVADITNRVNKHIPDKIRHYRNFSSAYDANPENLAICINSTINPNYASCLIEPNLLVIDEAAQTVRDIFSKHGTMGKEAPAVITRLAELLRRADTVVLLDADATDATVARYKQLSGRDIYVWDVPTTPHDCRVKFQSEAQITAATIEAISRGERALIMSDSAQQAQNMHRLLQDLYPRSNGMVVHSAVGTGTSDSIEVKRLLADINTEATKLDWLIVSPTVQSGVSLTISYFTFHAAFYSGTITPQLMVQMLRRDRTAREINIAIVGTGCKKHITDRASIVNNLEAAMRQMIEIDGKIVVTPLNSFTVSLVMETAVTNQQLNEYGALLYFMLVNRGFKVSTLNNTVSKVGIAAEKLGRIRSNEAMVAAILTANDIPYKKAITLSNANIRTPTIIAEVARARLRKDLGLPEPIPIEPEHVEIWNRGKFSKQSNLFSQMLQGGYSNADLHDSKHEINPALRSFHGATAKAMRTLVDMCGIDLDTGAATLTRNNAQEMFLKLKQTSDFSVLLNAGIIREVPFDIMRWLTDALRKTGIKLVQLKQLGEKDKKIRVYEVDKYTWNIMKACVKNASGDCIGGGIASVLSVNSDLQEKLLEAKTLGASEWDLIEMVDKHLDTPAIQAKQKIWAAMAAEEEPIRKAA